jgi:hypothetical protein
MAADDEEAARVAGEEQQAAQVAAALEATRLAAELKAVRTARMAAEQEAARVAEELEALERARLAAGAARMPDERDEPDAPQVAYEMQTPVVAAPGATTTGKARGSAENKAIAAAFAGAAVLFALSRRAKRRAS